LLGSRRRHDEQREDQERTGDLTDFSRGAAEEEEEQHREQLCGDPPGDRNVRVDRGEEQRARDDGEGHEHAGPNDTQDEDLGVGDAEERAEEQAGEAVEEAAIEADEKNPARQAKTWTVPMTADSWL